MFKLAAYYTEFNVLLKKTKVVVLETTIKVLMVNLAFSPLLKLYNLNWGKITICIRNLLFRLF